MFVFRKILLLLFSCDHRFESHPFVLSPTSWSAVEFSILLTWWLSMHWIIMELFQVLINPLPLDHLQWFPLQFIIPSILWKTIGMRLHKNLTQKLLFQGRKCWCCVRRLFSLSHLKHLLHQFKLLLLIHHYHYSDSAFQVKHLLDLIHHRQDFGKLNAAF